MTDQVKYTQKLKGDRVLIVGGSSGFGYAVAEALVEHGSEVIISSSNEARVQDKVEALKKSYPSASSQISGYACDLADPSTIEANIINLLGRSGKLDHIIYTAGDKLALMPVDKAEVPQIQQAGVVRFVGPIILAKHAPKYLRSGPKSSIVLTTGVIADRPRQDRAIIGAYATGLQGLTRGLALELAPIRVNVVSPGMAKTELWTTIGMDKETQEATFKAASERLPTGVVPGPEQIAETYLYFLRDENVTGTMLSSNSGVLLLGP